MVDQCLLKKNSFLKFKWKLENFIFLLDLFHTVDNVSKLQKDTKIENERLEGSFKLTPVRSDKTF